MPSLIVVEQHLFVVLLVCSLLIFFFSNLCVALSLQELTTNSSSQQSSQTSQLGAGKTITISTARDWTDTGIDLQPGDALQIAVARETNHSSSSVQASCNSASPNSAPVERLRVQSSASDTLVAKLAANAAPFPVNAGRNISVNEAGDLYLAPNAEDNCPHQIGSSIWFEM